MNNTAGNSEMGREGKSKGIKKLGEPWKKFQAAKKEIEKMQEKIDRMKFLPAEPSGKCISYDHATRIIHE